MNTLRSLSLDSYPRQGSFEEQARYLLQYAILAPSAHNNQPWKVRIEPTEIIVSADPAYITKGGTPRLTSIALGAFVENYMEAAAAARMHVAQAPAPFRGDIAQFVVRIAPDDLVPDLHQVAFRGITERHTNRGLYETEPLSAETLRILQEVVVEDGVEVALITDANQRELAGKLVAAGMHIALSLPFLRRELSHFVAFACENKKTGMLAEAMVRGAAPSLGAETGDKWVLRDLPVLSEVMLCREKFTTAPLHVIISTIKDSLRDQFTAGRTMQRILNTAGGLGLTHCISAAVTEVPVIAPRIRAISGSSAKPQIFLRLGVPKDPGFTYDSPRRSVHEILKDH